MAAVLATAYVHRLIERTKRVVARRRWSRSSATSPRSSIGAKRIGRQRHFFRLARRFRSTDLIDRSGCPVCLSREAVKATAFRVGV